MSALWDNYTTAEKNEFIDAFAHELAEQQRAEGATWGTNKYTDDPITLRWEGDEWIEVEADS
jgi:hypothetical protein